MLSGSGETASCVGLQALDMCLLSLCQSPCQPGPPGHLNVRERLVEGVEEEKGQEEEEEEVVEEKEHEEE